MNVRELRKLRRYELLELLVDLSEENDKLRAKEDALQQKLEQRQIELEEAGSIAEAAMSIHHVFTDAQQAAQQYLENIKQLNTEAQGKADTILLQAKAESETMYMQTRKICEEMKQQTRADIEAKWLELKEKIDSYATEYGILTKKTSQSCDLTDTSAKQEYSGKQTASFSENGVMGRMT